MHALTVSTSFSRFGLIFQCSGCWPARETESYRTCPLLTPAPGSRLIIAWSTGQRTYWLTNPSNSKNSVSCHIRWGMLQSKSFEQTSLTPTNWLSVEYSCASKCFQIKALSPACWSTRCTSERTSTFSSCASRSPSGWTPQIDCLMQSKRNWGKTHRRKFAR